MSHHVTINYGPVDSLNLGISHKPQFVFGLRDRLLKLGYRVDLRPVEYLNYCMLEIYGYEIFKCNIKYLSFNKSYKKDRLCQLAISAVEESAAKFGQARLFPWLNELLLSRSFKGSSCKNRWPVDVEEMAGVKTCAEDCCRILLHKDTDAQEPPSEAKSHDEIHFDNISRAFSRRFSQHTIFQPTRSLHHGLEFKTLGDIFKNADEGGLMSQLNVEERLDIIMIDSNKDKNKTNDDKKEVSNYDEKEVSNYDKKEVSNYDKNKGDDHDNENIDDNSSNSDDNKDGDDSNDTGDDSTWSNDSDDTMEEEGRRNNKTRVKFQILDY